MNDLNEVFEDAKLYERYLFTKMNANGNLIWATLGFSGSIISYLLLIFSEAMKIDNEEIGPAIGSVWLLIVAAGILFSFKMSPELTINIDQKTDSTVGRNIGIGWMLSFLIGSVLAGIMGTVLDDVDLTLVAVSISIGLGNLNNYIHLRSFTKFPLFISIFILLAVPIIAITNSPQDMLVFGLAISVPYYIVGFYLHNIKMPAILQARTLGK